MRGSELTEHRQTGLHGIPGIRGESQSFAAELKFLEPEKILGPEAGWNRRGRSRRAQNGLYYVTTLTRPDQSKGTYALMFDGTNPAANEKRIVELVTSGTTPGIRPVSGATVTRLNPTYELEPDGNIVYVDQSVTPRSVKRKVVGWNGTDPQYTDYNISRNNYSSDEPLAFGSDALVKTNGGTIYVFQPKKEHTGKHLEAVTRGTTNNSALIWKTSPTGHLDGKGTFETTQAAEGEIGIAANGYGGSTLGISGINLFYVYRGEFWVQKQGANAGQANQIMHYKHVGTNFVFRGQFGLPRVDGSKDDRPGAAGNIWNFSLVTIGSTIYVYTSDEWSLGVHRWKVPNP